MNAKQRSMIDVVERLAQAMESIALSLRVLAPEDNAATDGAVPAPVAKQPEEMSPDDKIRFSRIATQLSIPAGTKTPLYEIGARMVQDLRIWDKVMVYKDLDLEEPYLSGEIIGFTGDEYSGDKAFVTVCTGIGDSYHAGRCYIKKVST